ncbi:MAG: phosphoribosylglycinamide formyltransferase [Gemmatimonadetes bacterium]|nr:phosphoribosylglycinamide formyltransferase [Gemmatimonadota bacterium]
MRARPKALAVFASGSGTNLQALLDRFGPDGHPDAAAAVRLVVSDRPAIGALERARAAGVETAVIQPGGYPDPSAFGRAILEALRRRAIEIVVLAGYLRLVPADVVAAFRSRMVNIHPAPLPGFGGPGLYGRRVHEAVLAAGLKVSGPTVHFVDERYDTGPIIAQWPVPVFADDTPDTLAARVLKVEHRLLPAVVSALARGEITLGADGRVRVPLDSKGRKLGYALADEDAALASLEESLRVDWKTSGGE